MTPGQLAAVEFVQPQSLTRMLAELESDDLVVRRAHPRDGRQYLEEITKAGRAALMVDLESRDPWLDRAMDALTPAERELLGIAARLMERMAETE
jgi:DNA-binding MarR family transcriptional regulator